MLNKGLNKCFIKDKIWKWTCLMKCTCYFNTVYMTAQSEVNMSNGRLKAKQWWLSELIWISQILLVKQITWCKCVLLLWNETEILLTIYEYSNRQYYKSFYDNFNNIHKLGLINRTNIWSKCWMHRLLTRLDINYMTLIFSIYENDSIHLEGVR